MISVSEAQASVLQQAQPLPPVRSILEQAVYGLRLAEDVVSDIDAPPFAKAMVDGYAIRAADLATGRAELHIIAEVAAGQTTTRTVEPGQAIRIMTGAPLPAGADAVVMVERSQLLGADRVQLEDKPPQPGQHILPRARELQAGQTVLRAGARLRPQEFGILAGAGRHQVLVTPRATVAIVSTGDEIVAAPAQPGPGQIRNTNGPMLVAQVKRAGGVARMLGIARDALDSLQALVATGLQEEVLVLSGGVSMGDRDLVPRVLREQGVQAQFHKVAMKPGKPVFFGTRGRTLVFGLPGNPVSSFVCFELFVRPALHRLRGEPEPLPSWVEATLTMDFAYRTDRPTYHPAWLERRQGRDEVRLPAWFGSADLLTLTQTNALAFIPAGEQRYQAGQQIQVLDVDVRD